MPDAFSLAGAAAALLPDGVGVGSADPGRRYPLAQGEELPGAVAARLAEFSAGRHAARAALSALGRRPVAMPMAPDRAPVWPPGVTGGITHSRTACLAAVANLGPLLRGLGLDLEEASPLAQELWDTVLRPEEQLWLARQPAAERGLLAKTVFSAKEAAYKAQYAVSGALFGFDALEVALEGDRFIATFRQAVPGFGEGARLQGRWGNVQGHILTAVVLG